VLFTLGIIEGNPHYRLLCIVNLFDGEFDGFLDDEDDDVTMKLTGAKKQSL